MLAVVSLCEKPNINPPSFDQVLWIQALVWMGFSGVILEINFVHVLKFPSE
jgi:hypothetical protein